MGGEGVTWVGQAPFTEEPHVFVNLGDGTYFHSGLLAVRQAVAAGVNITYKILYNDAVAMTGGQPIDGRLTVPQIAAQVHGEGAGLIAVVTDEPDKYPLGTSWPPGTNVYHRDALDRVQRQAREWPGVSVIIYDQTCAAEKRRRRKRGLYPDPPKRVFINEAVCEGCGDCGVKSNCLSIVPVETEFGRKRQIDQSSCNKDYSCVNGFCPSFVTVHGGRPRQGAAARPAPVDAFGELPAPALPSLDKPYGILVTGVGGTGVVTIGALIGMAAHLEGKGCSVLDMAGLAQKGGAVVSHLRIARRPEDIHAVRLAAGGARLVLGCDLVVAAGFEALAKIEKGKSQAIINAHETATGDFARNPDWRFPTAALKEAIAAAAGAENATFLEATRLATALLGDSIATNLFMLGYAWQRGLVPVSAEALERAIELNAVAVEANRQAFLWGRRAAHDLAAVERAATPIEPGAEPARTLDEIVARRIDYLTRYQDAAYARRYKDLVVAVQRAESQRVKGAGGLAEAVARYYFKLLAYKDEYEVARLHADPAFLGRVNDAFEGDIKLRFHLAPPLFARPDPNTGEPRKLAYGPWMLPVFRGLARLKRLRGTWLDPFGYGPERRTERRLIADYEATITELLDGLDRDSHALAVEIASLPEHIRGFGPVKQRHLAAARAREAALLQAFRSPEPARTAAE
jgi:indolepyruvate ferredoxin oxidoreductase